MQRGLAYRRHQQSRARSRARRTIRLIDTVCVTGLNRDQDPVIVGIRANTRTLPNQRVYDRPHVSHRRADACYREQLQEAA